MKPLIFILALVLIVLQYKLWAGDRSLTDAWQLGQAIEIQGKGNASLKERNEALAAEVKDLKEGLAAIEERARSELGMIREDENYYHVVTE